MDRTERLETPAPSLLDGITLGLLVVTIVLLPVNREFELVRLDGFPDLQHRVSYFLFDVPLLALSVLLLPRFVADVWRRALGWLPALMFLLIVLVGLSAVVEPSARGAQVVVRLACAGMVLYRIGIAGRGEAGLLTVALLASAALETALGLAQVVTREVRGLEVLGEFPPLLQFGNELAAKGTFVHPYNLAGWALVAAACGGAAYLWSRNPNWLGALAVAAIPVGITYSRTGLLAFWAVLFALALEAWRRDRRAAHVMVALVLGAVPPAVATLDGWLAKTDTAAGESSAADRVLHGRAQAAKDALGFMQDEPVFGIGPGLYVIALEDKLEDDPELRALYAEHSVEVLPVHNVVLLVGAEAGILPGLLFLGLLVFAGIRAVGDGGAALAVYLAYLPFLMFDAYPYTNPQGLGLVGVWLGFLEVLHRKRHGAWGSGEVAEKPAEGAA